MISDDFWLKPKQARPANKADSRRITEVTGEFSARSCDPPHPYMKNAPMAQKFCDQRRKTTFATQSALSGHCNALIRCPLSGVKRTSTGNVPMSAFDPKRTSAVRDFCSCNH